MFNRLFGAIFTPGFDSDQIRMVDPATIRQWYEADEAVIVDVRETKEFAAEHIPGATHVPLSSFDPSRVPVPSGKKLVVHCRSGSRCDMAAARLLVAGYEGDIHRMQGGIIGWKAAGGPVRHG